MNHEKFSKNRQAALKWWRELLYSEKEEFAKKHFPNWSITMVSASSSKIQRIWELEVGSNCR
jgi:hypothetical protein